MGGIGHVVSRIVTSSSSSNASYRSKRSRVKDLKLICLLTLLDQFQNQKDKFAFYFLLLLVVTATQGRRVAEGIQRFQLQSKLDGRAPLFFLEFQKGIFRICTKYKVAMFFHWIVGTLPPCHVAMWRSTPRRS